MTTPDPALTYAVPDGAKKIAVAVSSEKGRRILAFLSDELGLPSGLCSLSVHFKMNDVIRVEANFAPRVNASEDTKAGIRSY